MPDLTRPLRNALDTAVRAAREEAEAGAAEALRRLGVADARAPAHLDAVRQEQRVRLRAHARTLGDGKRADGTHEVKRLLESAAYVQWHRLLFARFLAERGLLRDGDGVAMGLADLREEAALAGEGDEWGLAAEYAARLLPGVFPPGDPAGALVLAPEHARALRNRLRGILPATFQSDDALGWTYQFWRAAEKKRVNDSQVKIGAAELPAVTQLFTEPYMVRFLLHNTLGAWWAAKVLAGNPALARDAADEGVLRDACRVPGQPGYAWDYLRFVRDGEAWRPAAGSFPGWPGAAAALTVLDPCCGSGHFLTEALAALAALRAAEEGLAPGQAVAAVLRDNLAGLELDGRCVQIAAFALVLAAWRLGGVQALPAPHVAWVGAPPPLPRAKFAAMGDGDPELRRGLEALHDLFLQAPLLGSLIEPTGGDLADPTRAARVEEGIVALVERMRGAEPERVEGAIAARGMADAAAILSQRWVLQATNVPYLGRRKQCGELADYLERRFEAAKSDLATAMLDRMRYLSAIGGTVATITPQNWLSQTTYAAFRSALLTEATLNFLLALGEEAWEEFGQRGPFATLTALTASRPTSTALHTVLDLTGVPERAEKVAACVERPMLAVSQRAQTQNPDGRIMLARGERQPLLSRYAASLQGIITGDNDRARRNFWELAKIGSGWLTLQTTTTSSVPFSGLDAIVWWGRNGEDIARAQGQGAWNKAGVAISQMRYLPAALLVGNRFDNNAAAIIPRDPAHLPAIWVFCSSTEYATAVRRIDQAVKVTNATLVKVPFDLAHWQQVAAERYPDGLPEPESDDPTQWLFHGHPCHAVPGTELHVALARLAGYRWPAETDPDMRLSATARERVAQAARLPAAETGGLLPLVPVLGDRALADRLRAWCAAAWGTAWQPGTEAALVRAACERAGDDPPAQPTLEAWLRTRAARQHCKLFGDRPFLWWIGDGRADGFACIANYHKLDRAGLDRLAWHVLGDWITRLGDDPRAEAAQVLQGKLAAIVEGEAPLDIFVRWKPLHRLPLGWQPDLDDGVRMNVRPFVRAGVLLHAPNVHWRTDRGRDVPTSPWYGTFGGERRNDHHTTLEEKRAARAAAGVPT